MAICRDALESRVLFPAATDEADHRVRNKSVDGAATAPICQLAASRIDELLPHRWLPASKAI